MDKFYTHKNHPGIRFVIDESRKGHRDGYVIVMWYKETPDGWEHFNNSSMRRSELIES